MNCHPERSLALLRQTQSKDLRFHRPNTSTNFRDTTPRLRISVPTMLRRTPHPRPAKFAACAPVSRLNWRRRWNRSTSICVFLNRESQNRLLQLRPLNEAGTVFCLFRLRKKSNAEGGGAFNPRKKPTESSGASAPEGCLPPNSHEMSSFSASSIDQRWFAPTMGKPEQVSISCDLPHRRGGLLAFTPGSARLLPGAPAFLTLAVRRRGKDARRQEAVCAADGSRLRTLEVPGARIKVHRQSGKDRRNSQCRPLRGMRDHAAQ
jgi:hypothetical protein